MMAYFKVAKDTPEILNQKIKFDQAPPDSNAGQEILPKDYVKEGNTYSIGELIEKLIIYSDNIAFDVLTKAADNDTLAAAFRDHFSGAPRRIEICNCIKFYPVSLRLLDGFFGLFRNPREMLSLIPYPRVVMVN
jgi:hypothetical protein